MRVFCPTEPSCLPQRRIWPSIRRWAFHGHPGGTMSTAAQGDASRRKAAGYRGSPTRSEIPLPTEALGAVRRRVWQYVILPAVFERCITDTASTTEEYARALYQIERRKVVHRLSPAHGYQKRHESPLPDPTAYDPWAIGDDELAKTTSCIARCPACDGTKKTQCSNCRGSGRVACGHCGGGGRVRGERGQRNCPSCNGAATRAATSAHEARSTAPRATPRAAWRRGSRSCACR